MPKPTLPARAARRMDELGSVWTGDAAMPLSIRDPETDRLARELARRTGETMTRAIRTALAERLARLERTREAEVERRRRAIDAIVARAHKLPVLDDRTPEEIISYDENGLPT
jgi:antitoxin VapB